MLTVFMLAYLHYEQDEPLLSFLISLIPFSHLDRGNERQFMWINFRLACRL
jgi:hypothetical protein